MTSVLRRDPDARGYFGSSAAATFPRRWSSRSNSWSDTSRRVTTRRCGGLDQLLKHYVGRPTPVYESAAADCRLRSARIFLKREDPHPYGGAQGSTMPRANAAGGPAQASAGLSPRPVPVSMASPRQRRALLELDCIVTWAPRTWIGRRSTCFVCVCSGRPSAAWMRSRTLKDAINEAMRDWVTNVQDAITCSGSVLGPHPYPLMVREFQSVIGREARSDAGSHRPAAGRHRRLRRRRQQCHGHFDAFIGDAGVRLVGVGREGRRSCRAGTRTIRRRQRGFCRDADVSFCRTTTATSSLLIPFPRVSITPASAPSTRGCGRSVARTHARATMRRCKAFQTLARLEDSAGPRIGTRHRVCTNVRQGTWRKDAACQSLGPGTGREYGGEGARTSRSRPGSGV